VHFKSTLTGFLIYNIFMKTKKTISILFYLFCILSLVYLMFNYSPSTGGPVGILLFFLLLYISITGIVFYLIKSSYKFIEYFYKYFFKKEIRLRNDKKSLFYYSILFSSIPIFLIAFKSVGDIGFFEIFLIFIFVLLGSFYIRKTF